MRTVRPPQGIRKGKGTGKMSEFRIKTLMARRIGAVDYKAEINEHVEISIRALDLDGTDYRKGVYFYSPRNSEAAKPLHGYFLPEEWDYQFCFRITDRGFVPHIQAIKKGMKCGVNIPCTRMSEDDYRYITHLYQQLFPRRKPTSLERITRMDIEEQLKPDRVFSCLSGPIQNAVVSMLLKRRKDFLNEGYIDIDPQKLWLAYEGEIVKALTEKTQKIMEENEMGFRYWSYEVYDAETHDLLLKDSGFEAEIDAEYQGIRDAKAKGIKNYYVNTFQPAFED